MHQPRMQVIGGNTVVTTSLREIENLKNEGLRDKVFRSVLMSGGALTFKITQRQIDLNTKDYCKDFEGLSAGTYIYMYEDFFKGMSRNAAYAALLHEIGHIRLKHVDILTAESEKWTDEEIVSNTKDKIPKISLNLEYELQADEFAAARVGEQAVIEMLNGVLQHTAAIAESHFRMKGKPFNRAEFIRDVQNDPLRVARVDALKRKLEDKRKLELH